MKTKLFLLILLVLVTGPVSAQTWQWAKMLPGDMDEGPNAIAKDSTGNLYVAGWFRSAQFTLDTITLTNASTGNEDLFLAKFTATGNVIWAKSFGTGSVESGIHLAVTPGGEAYVTGYFYGNNFILGVDNLVNAGSSSFDFFVAKFSSSGTPLWARRGGGTKNDFAYSVALQKDQGVSVTGTFYSKSFILGQDTLVNTDTNSVDMFVVRYDAQGNVKWARQSGGTGGEEGNSNACDQMGNTFVTGSFTSSQLTLGTYSLTNAGTQNLYVVKYDSSGTVQWALASNGTSTNDGRAISTDAQGNAYITGWYRSPVFTLGTYTLSNSGMSDAFVAKVDPAGQCLWLRGASGSSFDNGTAIATDSAGNCFVLGGFYSGTLNFGTSSLTNGTNSENIFVASYNTMGTLQWASAAGGGSADYGAGIVANMGGSTICGNYRSAAFNLGSITLTDSTFYSEGFLARVDNTMRTTLNSYVKNGSSIFPNPTNGSFTVISKEADHLEVRNLLGATVYSNSFTGPGETFMLSARPGIYFVCLRRGEKIVGTLKLLITH